MDTAIPSSSSPRLSDLEEAEAWLFDLDNTLYPASCRLFDQVDRNITQFIMQYLSLDWQEAYKVQKTYFREHGTSMRGMMDNHGTDPAEYLDFVHKIDLTPIDPNPAMDAALARLPGRKIIFTNGSVMHAEGIMEKLGIRDHFEAIYDIVASDYRPKPNPAVYDDLVQTHNLTPDRCVMIEDMARNLEPAAAMGMTCVWVSSENDWGREGAENDYVHHVVDDLTDWLAQITTN